MRRRRAPLSSDRASLAASIVFRIWKKHRRTRVTDNPVHLRISCVVEQTTISHPENPVTVHKPRYPRELADRARECIASSCSAMDNLLLSFAVPEHGTRKSKKNSPSVRFERTARRMGENIFILFYLVKLIFQLNSAFEQMKQITID